MAPKRPLQTPQREWLTENLIEWVEKLVLSLKDHAWFNAEALEEEWEAFKQSDKDNTFFLWQWLSIACRQEVPFVS